MDSLEKRIDIARSEIQVKCPTLPPHHLLANIMAPPIPGTDAPQPKETIGWKLNHICFRIQDPEATTRFYRDLLGMRTLFTVDAGSFSILYFGYPEVVGEHETGEELMRKRHNREGLIEFIHQKVVLTVCVDAEWTRIDYEEYCYEWILTYRDYCP
jgi:hypothetical protein